MATGRAAGEKRRGGENRRGEGKGKINIRKNSRLFPPVVIYSNRIRCVVNIQDLFDLLKLVISS
jgi:hypothetical protein